MPLICKGDKPELQIAMGEVYAPMRPDSDGEFMTKEEIRKTAHAFARSGRMAQIDVLHDNKVVKGCSVVETFVAGDDDTTYIPGSWVVGVHIPDANLWAAIKKGDINGFSMEALVVKVPREMDMEIPPVVQGKTSKSDDSAPHEHNYYVSYDEGGNFKGGMTDEVNGHSHPIVAGTHTQIVDGHSHRFSSVDSIEIQEEAA